MWGCLMLGVSGLHVSGRCSAANFGAQMLCLYCALLCGCYWLVFSEFVGESLYGLSSGYCFDLQGLFRENQKLLTTVVLV